jgi:hypothetical protein
MTLSFIATIIIAVIFTVIGIYLIGCQIKEKRYIDLKKNWYLIVFFDILYFFEIFLLLMDAYTNLK